MGQYFFCIKCLFILNVKWEYIVKPRIFKHSTRKILETSSFCSGDYDGTEQACSSQWGQAKDEKEGWEGQCSPWKAWESLRSPHPSLTRGAGLSPAPQLLPLLLGSGSHLPNLHFTASFSPHIWDRIHLSLQTAQPSNIADFLTPFSGIITRSFSISHAPALPPPPPRKWISFPVCDLQLLLSDVKAGHLGPGCNSGPPALIASLFSLLLRTDQLPWANGVIGSSLEFHTSFTSLGIFIYLSVCGPYGSLNHS